MPLSNSETASQSDRLAPLRGEFVDAALERSFRVNTLARVVPQQRIGLLVWALLLLFFGIPDYLAMGLVPGFGLLAGYRIAMAVLLLVYRAALQRRPELALNGHLLMWLGLLSYPFFFLFYVVRPEMRAINTGVIMVIQLTMFVFLPARVMLVLPVALLGSVGTVFSYWAVSSAEVSLKVGAVFLLNFSAVMGYLVALRLQKNERQEYLLRQQLQSTNLELQQEVAQRLALQQELERQAATDLLTALPNRRAFTERFAVEAERAKRSGGTLSVAIFDLDHFKLVNDRYGHTGGDTVLRHVGQLCMRSFRGVDMAARIGGEEFAVLLPDTSTGQAVAALERFITALAHLDIQLDAQSVRVTATAGVAQQHRGETMETLMARADGALYAGKQAGRNRVVLAPAPH